jgi:hypothetical protein
VPVGEHGGADRDRLSARNATGCVTDRDLGRSTADVDYGKGSQRGNSPRRAAESEASLVLARQDLERYAGSPLDRGHELARVRGAADRRRRNRSDSLGAQIARAFGLFGDDRGRLVDLVRWNPVAIAQAAPDQCEHALVPHVPEAARDAVGDE